MLAPSFKRLVHGMSQLPNILVKDCPCADQKTYQP